jgi:hypothetical protein
LEAGPLSQWLFSALAEADLPVVRVETRHMQAVLKAQTATAAANCRWLIARGPIAISALAHTERMVRRIVSR